MDWDLDEVEELMLMMFEIGLVKKEGDRWVLTDKGQETALFGKASPSGVA